MSTKKKEMEILEQVRTLSGIPLTTIQDTLKSLSAVISLEYAKSLRLGEGKGDVELTIPYVGVLKLKGDRLLLTENTHSFCIKELADVKRALDNEDYTLIEKWYNVLKPIIEEKV